MAYWRGNNSWLWFAVLVGFDGVSPNVSNRFNLLNAVK